MNTYIAQIVYRIKCNDISDNQQEEQWRLICANNIDRATEEAVCIGKAEETTFTDRKGRDITWEFAAVKDIQPAELSHGSILFSAIKDDEPIIITTRQE